MSRENRRTFLYRVSAFASLVSLVLCVAMVALWVRSYRATDRFLLSESMFQRVELVSQRGSLLLLSYQPSFVVHKVAVWQEPSRFVMVSYPVGAILCAILPAVSIIRSRQKKNPAGSASGSEDIQVR